MFGRRYFGGRMFGPRYFGPSEMVPAAPAGVDLDAVSYRPDVSGEASSMAIMVSVDAVSAVSVIDLAAVTST